VIGARAAAGFLAGATHAAAAISRPAPRPAPTREQRQPRRAQRRLGGGLKVIAASVLGAVLAGVLGLVGIVTLRSGRDPVPFRDAHGAVLAGSVAEKVRVRINGVQQGMVIRGRDVANPVLLIVHGGPGMPDYFLTRTHPIDIEDLVTVVWWDQRGTALSYDRDTPPETMTVEQFIDDTLAVTDHLRERFATDRIYLLGHSWGTLIGIQAVARAPERYEAYIGMAQMTDQRRSEKIAYDHMLAEYRRRGDLRMVRALEAVPVTLEGGPPPEYVRTLRDKAMHRLGVGTTRDMDNVFTGIVLASLLFPEYTLREKLDLWRGRSFSRGFRLWEDEVLRTDIPRLVPRLEVPAYFFAGAHDYTCVTRLAQAYVEVLEAPAKGFHVFENSAHSPLFEEPSVARRLLRDEVLRHPRAASGSR
jgi:pimeloyl-ACP methyl ester carboxylesterase